MARMKRPNATEDDPMVNVTEDDYVDSEEQLVYMHCAPFPVYNPIEGSFFERFRDQSITASRCLDWELLESLGVKAKVLKLLKNLGLETYALMKVIGNIYQLLLLGRKFWSYQISYAGVIFLSYSCYDKNQNIEF